MSARRRPVIALMYGGQTRPSWDGPGQQLLIGVQGRGRAVIAGQGPIGMTDATCLQARRRLWDGICEVICSARSA